MIISLKQYNLFRTFLASLVALPLAVGSTSAFADLPIEALPVNNRMMADRQIQDQISDEIHQTELAVQRLKMLRDQKPMSGRGWTALDDIVVGGSTIATSGGLYGLLYALPKVFPKAKYLNSTHTSMPKVTSLILVGIGALTLAQGLVVYAFVPKAELATGNVTQVAQDQVAVERLDVSSLTQKQAEALLARLHASRVELEESANTFQGKITPKLESRLAFISSNIISGGLALTAIGGGLYLVLGQSGRMVPMLMRMKKTSQLGSIIQHMAPFFETLKVQLGLNVAFQGASTALSGVVVKFFVPKNTTQAAPVN